MAARVILADPPWSYNDKLTMSDVKRSSDSHYSTLSVDDICAFQIPVTASDAFLFLWVTNPFLLDGSGSRVCEAWGFKPKQLITWVKGRIVNPEGEVETLADLVLNIGLGHYTRGATEQIILGVKGTPKCWVKDHSVPNVIVAPRQRHSAKPDVQYELIERLVDGPYVELFARKRREGWVSFGNELG